MSREVSPVKIVESRQTMRGQRVDVRIGGVVHDLSADQASQLRDELVRELGPPLYLELPVGDAPPLTGVEAALWASEFSRMMGPFVPGARKHQRSAARRAADLVLALRATGFRRLGETSLDDPGGVSDPPPDPPAGPRRRP